MQIQIISVGRDPSKAITELVTEYETRLRSYCQLIWAVLPPSRIADSDGLRADESARILQTIKASDVVILLDERGLEITNAQLAQKLEGWLGRQGRVVFIIGGAYGVDELVRARADFVWSLSSLVFPHQVVRLLLVEQLYRSFAILDHHPYHHG